ncbi:MAG: hypothetical protein HQL53_03120, partial [Magnetococcales bacterium]|nr:hypothetical protein [Magnetococcales bacterium]
MVRPYQQRLDTPMVLELFHFFFDTLSIRQRKIVIGLHDVVITALAVWASFLLRLSDPWAPFLHFNWPVLIIAPAIAVPIYYRFRLYRQLVRYSGQHTFFSIIKATTLITMILMALAILINTKGTLPRSSFIIFWVLMVMIIGGNRIIMRAIIFRLSRFREGATRVAIYGAGWAGAQLAKALLSGSQFVPTAFLDDDPKKRGAVIHGLSVFPPNDLEKLHRKLDINGILLAIPSLSGQRKR